MQYALSTETTVVTTSDNIGVRHKKSGSGPPLVLMHTIRTQLEYFRELEPLLAGKYTVYAIDLPGHGHSPIDRSAPYDEEYLRKGVIGFIENLNLSGVTLVGESIGAVLALTVAASLPQRVKQVFALNTYDYDMRSGDGIRRGNWFANMIIGSLQIPVLGPVFASLEDRFILRKIMDGGFHDPKLPADLVTEFDKVGRRPNYRYVERKVLLEWRSWGRARDLYAGVQAPVTLIYGDKDWSRLPERERTRGLLRGSRMVTLNDSGHFSALESPREIASIILGA